MANSVLNEHQISKAETISKIFFEKLYGACALLASCSAQVALRKLLCASCSAQVLPKLRDCALRTTFVLKIYDFAAGAAGLYFAHYFCTEFTILQPELRDCTLRTVFVLKIYDFAAGAAGLYFAHYFCT